MYIYLFIAGVLLLGFGLFLLIKRIHFIKTGIITEATVFLYNVTIKRVEDGPDEESYYPIFKYYTHDNQELIIEAKKITGYFKPWLIGDKAKVAYQKDQPRKAVLLTYWDAFWLVIILFSAAFVLLFISGGYYWAQHFFNTLT
jgi:hypothetical protein